MYKIMCIFTLWLLGVAVCLSFSAWSEYRIFGLILFEVLDHLATHFIMPLSGLAISIYVGWKLGKVIVMDEISLEQRSFALWFNLLRYVVPVGITLVFLYELVLRDLLILLQDWLK